MGDWGHRQSVIQNKVGFGQGTNTHLLTHTHKHTQLLLLSIQGGRVTHTRHKIQVVEPPEYMFTQKFTPFGLLLEHLANSYRFCKYTSLILDGEG